MKHLLIFSLVFGILLVGTFSFIDLNEKEETTPSFDNTKFFYGPVKENVNQTCFWLTGKNKIEGEVCKWD